MPKYWLSLLVCIYGLTLVKSRRQYMIKKMYFVDSIMNCPNETDRVSILIRNYTFTRHGLSSFVNGWVEVTTSEEPIKELEVFNLKCADNQKVDGCEYFANWYSDEACFFLKEAPNAKKLFLPEWLTTCRMKKGVHHIKNSTLDMHLYAPFYIHYGKAASWRIRVKLYRNHKRLLISCLDIILRYSDVRVVLENN